MKKQLYKVIWVAFHLARNYLMSVKYYLRVLLVAGIFALPALLPDLESAYQDSPLASMETVMQFVDDSTDGRFGIVDQAGITSELSDKYSDIAIGFEDQRDADQALRAKEINRYYVIPPDFLKTNVVTFVQRDDKVVSMNSQRVTNMLKEARAMALGVEDPNLIARLVDPGDVESHGGDDKLVAWIKNFDFGKLSSAGIVTLFFYLVLSSSGFMMVYALEEEADNRVLEVVRTSTSPEQLIGGKLLGITMVLFVEVGITFAALVWAYQREGALLDVDLSLTQLVLAGLYFLAGYIAFSSVTLSVMSWVPSGMLEKYELQSIIRDIGLLPLVGVVFIVVDPHSLASTILSIFPFTSALVMPFRLFYTDVSFLQAVLGLGFAVIWAGGAMWGAARIFQARYAFQ